MNYSEKIVKTKKDWLDILKNEDQEDNLILEILFYMMDCKNRTSNEINIMKALDLDVIPNSEIASFGRRIIKLKNIKVQEVIRSTHQYWNIPFTIDSSKNVTDIYTWKVRDELAEALIEKYNLTFNDSNSLDEQFNEYLEMLPPAEYNKRIESELILRNEFVNKFNIDNIINMELDDFVTGRSSIDERGKESFCYLIESKMRQLGDMRGARADKFGIYYSKKDKKYKYAKKYGKTLEDAFGRIKEEICKLIIAGSKEDYDSMNNSMLPPLFKGKILSTYFPEKYLCIFKEEDIDNLLYKLEVSYDIHEINTIEKKKRILKEYKDNNLLFSKYSDYYFIRFLYNFFKNELKEKHTVNGEIDYYKITSVDFEYLGGHKIEKKQLFRSRTTEYEKINRNKKDIGDRGEKAILKYEKNKLNKLGLIELADKVELTENDAIGYDIVSYDEKGNEKHIEVKTNSGNSEKIIMFYLSDNELTKMMEDPNYYIYYLYNIKNNPHVHIINKDKLLQQKENYLQPIMYKVAIDVKKNDFKIWKKYCK